MTREEAIVILDGFKHNPLFNEQHFEALDMAISALSENKGEWIPQDIHNCHTDFKCSKCGYIHSFMHLYGKPTADYTYCPNCGARMESEDKE